MTDVSWYDCHAYGQWLVAQTGKRYRLPSAAEYAGRAGTDTARFWGNATAQRCRFANGYDRTSKSVSAFSWNHLDCDDGEAKLAPVASHVANDFGVFDVIANVREWTAGCWNPSYARAPADGSSWTSGECSRHVGRGGSWDVNPWYNRFANRYELSTKFRHAGNLGFRVAEDF